MIVLHAATTRSRQGEFNIAHSLRCAFIKPVLILQLDQLAQAQNQVMSIVPQNAPGGR